MVLQERYFTESRREMINQLGLFLVGIATVLAVFELTYFVSEQWSLAKATGLLALTGAILIAIGGINKKGKKQIKMKEWFSVKDGLPPVGEEVIVLNKDGRISFGHIVDPEEAVSTDGWNIPDVMFWTPCEFTRKMKRYYKEFM